VPLATLEDGATGRLVSVEGGTHLRAKLLAMGLRRGATVRVVKNGGAGPFVLAMQALRLVLGRGIARHVYVARTDAGREG
jgi:Fe2+ transport system protein FeoA